MVIITTKCPIDHETSRSWKGQLSILGNDPPSPPSLGPISLY